MLFVNGCQTLFGVVIAEVILYWGSREIIGLRFAFRKQRRFIMVYKVNRVKMCAFCDKFVKNPIDNISYCAMILTYRYNEIKGEE